MRHHLDHLLEVPEKNEKWIREGWRILRDAPTWAARVRHARCILLHDRAIHGHHDDLGSVIQFPYGFGWRTVGTHRYCPYCQSINPDDMLAMMETVQFWTPFDKIKEMRELVDRGEMEQSYENMMQSQLPPEYHGYVHYGYMGPITQFNLVTNEGMATLMLTHVTDMQRPEADLAFHLNRLNPHIVWNFDGDGDMVPSFTGGISVTTGFEHLDNDEEPQDPTGE